MAQKYKLTMRTSTSPHLYLDQIKEIIKDDDYLLPQMRKSLVLLKKFKRSYIQLPLQMEVVVSSEFSCNLERPLSPQLLQFNKTNWDQKDIDNWKKDKKEFINKMIKLYNKMGYEVEESFIDDKTVKIIIDDIDAKIKKFGGHLLDKIK